MDYRCINIKDGISCFIRVERNYMEVSIDRKPGNCILLTDPVTLSKGAAYELIMSSLSIFKSDVKVQCDQYTTVEITIGSYLRSDPEIHSRRYSDLKSILNRINYLFDK